MSLFSHFRKASRQNLALILAGIAFASFGYHLYLWSLFMGTQPRIPNTALGLIYPTNNHGWVYYLSASQASELGMLMYMFFAFGVVGAITYGHHAVKEPWEKYRLPDKGSGLYLAISFLLFIGVLWFSSSWMASILVSKGIILDPW